MIFLFNPVFPINGVFPNKLTHILLHSHIFNWEKFPLLVISNFVRTFGLLSIVSDCNNIYGFDLFYGYAIIFLKEVFKTAL